MWPTSTFARAAVIGNNSTKQKSPVTPCVGTRVFLVGGRRPHENVVDQWAKSAAVMRLHLLNQPGRMRARLASALAHAGAATIAAQRPGAASAVTHAGVIATEALYSPARRADPALAGNSPRLETPWGRRRRWAGRDREPPERRKCPEGSGQTGFLGTWWALSRT